MDMLQLSALELSRKIRSGEISVKEAVSGYREQMQKMEPQVHAFLSVDDDKLEKRIQEVEEGIQSGRYQGPLAGVPIAVKDNICTKGQKTTCASRILENFVPAFDAEAVKRLEEAGMIVLGKTNMDEFAMGSTTETSAFGVTRNPWNTEHVPGGSSGGSCAAVAAGEAVLALGSDTGGSIRQPAAYCGVTGLKPTYGRVSRYGLIAYASSLDQIGPVGRNVKDCAALFEVLAGHDEKDSTSSGQTLESWEELVSGGMEGMKIGVPEEYFAEGTDEEVKKALTDAMELMRQHGAQVEYFSLGMVDYVIPSYYIIACAEASSNLERFDGVKYGYRSPEATELHEMYKKSRAEGFGEEVKRRILLGSFVLSAGYYDAYYLKALKVRRLVKEDYDKAFKDVDVIICPAAPSVAYKIGEKIANPLEMYLQDACTVPLNLAGLPGISVPCGYNKDKMPIGMQIIGKALDEETILRVAYTYEQSQSYHEDRAQLGGK